MKKSLLYLAITNVCLLTAPSYAADPGDNNQVQVINTYSMQGFTGVFNTPNASVVNYGDFGLAIVIIIMTKVI